MAEPTPTTDPAPSPSAARTLIGGALMGVANIIPGVSGGTMILATGLYETFVDSVADITRLRWRLASWQFIALLAAAAVVAIGVSVFPIAWGLENCHDLMFALFIGLTLGGVPLLWREIHPIRPSAIVAAVVGVAIMAFVAFALRQTPLPQNFLTYLIAGFIASAAMVLPGISGSYLLLIFGLYAPLTLAIKGFIGHLKGMEIGAAVDLGTAVILPIGLGVVLGIAGLTNVLKALLHRFHHATLGFLMGLLLGSVLGLYPFQTLTDHETAADGTAQIVVMAEAPEVTAARIALVLLMAVVGFGITFWVSRLGNERG